MARGSERIASLDVARGGTILLVVLYHAYLAAGTIGPVEPVVQRANELLQNVRMPMFFFCSGILASWGLNRRWSEVLTGRVWTMVWIYLVWSLLTLGLDQLYPVMPWRERAQEISSFLWLSYSAQWFIYALVLATLFARAIYHLPLALQICLALVAKALLHLWSPRLTDYTTNFDYLVSVMASYGLLFFLTGIWTARFVLPVLTDRRVALGVFVGATTASAALLALYKTVLPGLPQAVQAAPGVLAGLALASLLAQVAVIRAPMQWVGRRTLEIFVCHQFVIGAVTPACIALGASPTAAFAIIGAATLVAAIAFAWVTTASGPRLLFRPPKSLMRRPRPAAI